MQKELFNGNELANLLLNTLITQVTSLAKCPLLAIVLVGDDERSLAYIRQKQRFAQQINANIALFHFLSAIPTDQLQIAVTDIQKGRVGEWKKYIAQEQDQSRVSGEEPDGIIIQRPLPKSIDYNQILIAVDPARDIDGFHPDSPFLPPVGLAVIKILATILHADENSVSSKTNGKTVAIVGSGETAGKPIIRTLMHYSIRPIVINNASLHPQQEARKADILITAVGKPQLVTSDWIKKGAIVIDVGIGRVANPNNLAKTRLSGDCDESVRDIALVTTPVPGGVGPVNVACLMQNFVTCAKQRQSIGHAH